MLKSTKVDFVFLFFTAIWGLSFPLTKNVLDYTSIFSFLSLRFTSAAILLIIIFWKRLKLINLRTILCGSLIGLTFFGSLAFQVSSLYFTTSSNSALISLIQVIFCAIFYNCVSFMIGSKPIIFNAQLAVSIFVTGILGTALAYTGLVFFQKFTSPTHTALIFCAEPVFATIFAMFIANNKGIYEVITLNTFIGCVMILASMLISEFKIGNNILKK